MSQGIHRAVDHHPPGKGGQQFRYQDRVRRGELRGQDTCLEAGVLHGDDATEGDLASRAAGSGQDDELLVQLHGNLHLYDPPAGIGILHAQNLGDVDHTASAHGDDAPNGEAGNVPEDRVDDLLLGLTQAILVLDNHRAGQGPPL